MARKGDQFKPRNHAAQSNQQLEKQEQEPLQKFTNSILQQIVNRQLKLDSLSLRDLKNYLVGLSLYKTNLKVHIHVVEQEITKKQAMQRIAPTTAKKSNSKSSEQRTDGWQWGSCLFGWLQQLVKDKQTIKSNDQKGYSSVPSQELKSFSPSQLSVDSDETLTSSKRYLKDKKND